MVLFNIVVVMLYDKLPLFCIMRGCFVTFQYVFIV